MDEDLRKKYRRIVEIISVLFLVYFWGGGDFNTSISAPYLGLTLDETKGKWVIGVFIWIFFFWSYRCYLNNVGDILRKTKEDLFIILNRQCGSTEMVNMGRKACRTIDRGLTAVERVHVVSLLVWKLVVNFRRKQGDSKETENITVNPTSEWKFMLRHYYTSVFHKNGLSEDTLPCLLWYLALLSGAASLGFDLICYLLPMLHLAF